MTSVEDLRITIPPYDVLEDLHVVLARMTEQRDYYAKEYKRTGSIESVKWLAMTKARITEINAEILYYENE